MDFAELVARPGVPQSGLSVAMGSDMAPAYDRIGTIRRTNSHPFVDSDTCRGNCFRKLGRTDADE